MFEVYIAKIVFLPNFLNNKFPFMLPSHNCIIIITMFSFQGASLNLSRDSMKHLISKMFQSISLSGGEYRDRTGDLLLARQALSQLS